MKGHDTKLIGKIAGGITLATVAYIVIALIPLVSVYGSFARGSDFDFSNSATPYVEFKNENPFVLPQYTPLFMGEVKIVSSNETFQCSVNSVNNKTPCDGIIDLGKIPSGESGKADFTAFPMNKNFIIESTPYLNLFKNIPLQTKIWQCTYLHDYTYHCS